jgi:hypothetical protein
MRPEQYRRIRNEGRKRKGKLSARKSRMLAAKKEQKPITSPELREIYSARVEWATKLLPKLK